MERAGVCTMPAFFVYFCVIKHFFEKNADFFWWCGNFDVISPLLNSTKILIFPSGIGYCSQITSWWAFFMPNNSLGKYTAALSIKIHALRGIFFEFSDGIMAAVFLPLTLNSKIQ